MAPAAVSLDCFGTLLRIDPPADPAAAVASSLADRGLPVAEDWSERYRRDHLGVAGSEEVSLYRHVAAALAAGNEPVPDEETIAAAVDEAFEPVVAARPRAVEALETLADRFPVGVLSNSAVPGLVERSIERSGLPEDAFSAVVASVDVGYRKPDPRAFRTMATALDVDPSTLVHVGDDARTDGGIADLGGEFVSVDETSLESLADHLEGEM
ncbi:MAG: HAD family hydrolase [Halanaeroarchaeum sp.]